MTCCWPSDSSRLQRKMAESPAVGALRPRAFAGAQSQLSRPGRGRTRLLARRSPGKIVASKCAYQPPIAELKLRSIPPWRSDAGASQTANRAGLTQRWQPTELALDGVDSGLGAQFSSSLSPPHETGLEALPVPLVLAARASLNSAFRRPDRQCSAYAFSLSRSTVNRVQQSASFYVLLPRLGSANPERPFLQQITCTRLSLLCCSLVCFMPLGWCLLCFCSISTCLENICPPS